MKTTIVHLSSLILLYPLTTSAASSSSSSSSSKLPACTKDACYSAFIAHPSEQFCARLTSPTPLPLPSFASSPCGGWWNSATSACHCLTASSTSHSSISSSTSHSSTSTLATTTAPKCTTDACYSAFLAHTTEQFCVSLHSPTPLPLPSFASSPCGGWWNSATSVCSCLAAGAKTTATVTSVKLSSTVKSTSTIKSTSASSKSTSLASTSKSSSSVKSTSTPKSTSTVKSTSTPTSASQKTTSAPITTTAKPTATAFAISSCPSMAALNYSRASVVITTGVNATLTPITAALYTAAPSATPQLELDVSGVRYIYDTSNPSALTVISSTHESLTVLSNGSFVYKDANCSYGIRGSIGHSIASPHASVAEISKRQIPDPDFQVNVFIQNQCNQTFSSAAPHLRCASNSPQGGSGSFFDSPIEDFSNVGGGQFQGTCNFGTGGYLICRAGAAVCSPTGSAAFSAVLPCLGIAAAAAVAADDASAGVAIPVTSVIVNRVNTFCLAATGLALNNYCAYEYPSGGAACHVPPVTPIVSLSYMALPTSGQEIVDAQWGTVTTLAPVTYATAASASASATINGIEPTCTISNSPVPTVATHTCPYGFNDNVYVYCSACYESKLDWNKGEMLDIYCDICCGCCFTAYQGIYADNPTTPEGLCCSADRPCTSSGSTCAGILSNDRSCSWGTPEQRCDAWLGGPDGDIPISMCYDPDEYAVFNPLPSSKWSKCLLIYNQAWSNGWESI